VHVTGDLSKLEFLAYYFKGDKVVAACGMNKNAGILTIGAAM